MIQIHLLGSNRGKTYNQNHLNTFIPFERSNLPISIMHKFFKLDFSNRNFCVASPRISVYDIIFTTSSITWWFQNSRHMDKRIPDYSVYIASDSRNERSTLILIKLRRMLFLNMQFERRENDFG